MISGKLYATLDEEEKKLWHSHIFEVKSGMVVMPAPNTVPQMIWEKAERAELEQLITLYGKTSVVIRLLPTPNPSQPSSNSSNVDDG